MHEPQIRKENLAAEAINYSAHNSNVACLFLNTSAEQLTEFNMIKILPG